MNMTTEQGADPDPAPCGCGGPRDRVELAAFDFSPLCGLPFLMRCLPGLVCRSCGTQSVEAKVRHRALRILVGGILHLPRRLLAGEARYLRKHLCLTKRELADKLGVRLRDVRQWEGKLKTERKKDVLDLGPIAANTERKARRKIRPKWDAALRALMVEPSQAGRGYLN